MSESHPSSRIRDLSCCIAVSTVDTNNCLRIDVIKAEDNHLAHSTRRIAPEVFVSIVYKTELAPEQQ